MIMEDLKTLVTFILFLYENRHRNLWRVDIAREWKKDPAHITRLVKLALENNLIEMKGHVVKLTPFGERMSELLREIKRRTGIDPTQGEEAIMTQRQAMLDLIWSIIKWLPAPWPNPPIPIWIVEGATPDPLQECYNHQGRGTV